MADELRVMPGTLLAAWPDLADPNFMHSVVLLCQHTAEGAYGLVVNRATDLSTKVLLPEHPTLGAVDFPIHLGGPVDHTSLQFVHREPEAIPGGVSLDGRVWLGGDLDALGRFVAQDPPAARKRVRILVGYSGWGGGQLDVELATGSWVPAPLDLEAVFGEPGEGVWRRVVRSIGREGEDLGSLPPDVSWN